MFAEVTSAPVSMLIIVISLLRLIAHMSLATDVCVTVYTRSFAATAVVVLVEEVHWLCHLASGLLVDRVHRLCHLDLGLIVVNCIGLKPCSG